MKKSPQAKYNKFGVVLNAKKESINPTEELTLFTSLLLGHKDFFVATIIHDKDILENGEPKTIHAHAFIETNDLKYTEKQFLKLINEILKIEENQITIEGTNNEFLLVQYMLHKNQPKKTPYPKEKIETNDLNKLNERLEETRPTKQSKEMELLEKFKTARSLLDLAEKIGISEANRYRSTFNQIKREQNLDYEGLVKINNLFINLLEELDLLLTDYVNTGIFETKKLLAIRDFYRNEKDQLD